MINEYAQKIRRQLHMYPETGFDLPKTLGLLRSELDGIGVEYTEKYGKSCIVATINPEKPRYTIGIRADMDALPITEGNDVEFKSRIDGKMHACGHDAHTAIALTTLRELYSERDKINCRVKFFFQSGEEAYCGAKYMVEEGAADDVDCIIALHVDATLNVGKIKLMQGEVTANADHFNLEFFGKPAHTSLQHVGVDANMTAIKAFTAIEFMIAKEVAPRDLAVFNAGKIKGGTANNIVSDYCIMGCTLRTWSDETEKKLMDGIKKISELSAQMSGAAYKFTHINRYPIVRNDDIVADKLKKSAETAIGYENIVPQERRMDAEDFAYFTNKKPSAMFWLGVANDKRTFHSAHTAKFDIDENALDIGIRIFKQFVYDNMDVAK